ncbi:MAG: hypothetical protein RR551_04005 [Mucinivorans sp.]
MNNFQLIEVKTASHIKLFHSLARDIYKNDPHWVQPLVSDIEHIFDPRHNQLFTIGGGGQAVRWIVRDLSTDKFVGRLAAFFNREKVALETLPTGGCGFFESIDNPIVSRLMFDAAREWLAAHGIEAMDGPINFGDRMQWWGLLTEGFTEPLYAMPYARPYYAALFEDYGFLPYFNQITYLRPFYTGIELPAPVKAKAERLAENPEYSFRTFDKKNKLKMARDFCNIYNSGWAKIQGVKPLTEDSTLQMIRQMSPIIDPEVLMMAYHKDLAVGFFVILPDINQIVKSFNGRFGLCEKLRLLYSIRTHKITRLSGLIFGVAAEYQGKGIEAGLIYQLEQYIIKRKATSRVQYDNLQMGWIGDFNPVMIRMCESYVRATRYKHHITYRYLFDRTLPFERCPRRG